jgi:copper(I)-binding protein
MRRTLIPCGLAAALLSAQIAGAQNQPMHGHGQMAQSFAVGDLVVEAPWARESVTKTGAVYLSVRNGGDQDDRLIGVSSDVAETVQLHESKMQDGVMKMGEVETVAVPAHGEAMLAPGGIHVMLIGLKAPLEEGRRFPLTLTFEHAGEVEVMTTIEDIGHRGEAHDHSN